MAGELFRKTLWDMRGALVGWSIALFVLGFITMLFWPIFKDAQEFDQYWDEMPEEVREMLGGAASITSLEGFLDSQLFAFAPVLLMVLAVMWGSRLVNGEQAEKTIDLLMSHPIRRRDVMLEKGAALAVLILVVLLSSWVGLLGGALAIQERVPIVKTFLAAVFGVLPVWAAAYVTFLASAFAQYRKTSVMVGTIFAAVSWIMPPLVSINDATEPIEVLSVMHWYSGYRIMLDGLGIGLVVPFLVALACFAVAVWGFERKEILV